MALALWRGLRDRSETDRRFVLAALEKARRAAHEPSRMVSVTTDAAWAVLRRFLNDPAASSSSSKSYRQWRPLQRDQDQLPSEATLRRRLGDGSWTTLLDRAQERFKADVTVRRLTALGPFFTVEEIVEGIQNWLATHAGASRLRDFLADCRERMADPDYQGPRLPLSRGAIDRRGGWRRLLEKADTDGALRRAALPPAAKGPTDDVIHVSSRPGRAVYSSQQVKDFLMRAQAAEGLWLSRRAYDRLARQWRRDLLAAGAPPWVPCAHTVCDLLGMAWGVALAWAAEVPPAVVSEAGSGYGHKRSAEALEAQVSQAMDELGEDLTIGQFHERRLALRAAGRRDVCCTRSISDRLGNGSWPVAMERVRQQRAAAPAEASATTAFKRAA